MVWKPGLCPPAGLSGIWWGHSRRTWGCDRLGHGPYGSGELGNPGWRPRAGEGGFRGPSSGALGQERLCLTWPCCCFLSALGPPCAWCVGSVSVLICSGVKPRAVSPFGAESGSHSTGEKGWCPCATLPSCGFTTPCSYLRAHLPCPRRLLPVSSVRLQRTQHPCGEGIGACALRSASGQNSGPGLCQLPPPLKWTGVQARWKPEVALWPPHCVCAWCPLVPHSGTHGPSLCRHTPARLQPSLSRTTCSLALSSRRPFPSPDDTLSLASFQVLKQVMKSPLGTLLCTPLRPTHELFLEHIGSVLRSLAGLPGCCAVACAPPRCWDSDGDSSPLRALLVQTARPWCAPHSASRAMCEAGGGGRSRGPALLPSGLHLLT